MLFGERIQWFHDTGRSIRVKKNLQFQKYPDSSVNLPVAKNLFSMKQWAPGLIAIFEYL